jgi:hypothetical protein
VHVGVGAQRAARSIGSDVLFGEDTHRAYLGGVAHAVAALRNLALIRLAGHTGIKHVMERHHANKLLIPALLNTSQP